MLAAHANTQYKHLNEHMKEGEEFLAPLMEISNHIFEQVEGHERHDHIWKIFLQEALTIPN